MTGVTVNKRFESDCEKFGLIYVINLAVSHAFSLYKAALFYIVLLFPMK